MCVCVVGGCEGYCIERLIQYSLVGERSKILDTLINEKVCEYVKKERGRVCGKLADRSTIDLGVGSLGLLTHCT